MIRLLRSAYVIARRDFAATVLSKTFIFFLLGPLFPLLLGGLFGTIGARVATQTERQIVAVVASPGDFAKVNGARNRLARAIGDTAVVQLIHFRPEADTGAQRKRLLATSGPPIRAVLSLDSGIPRLTGGVRDGDVTTRQVNLILDNARRPSVATAPLLVTSTNMSSRSLARDRAMTAQIGQMLLFFLTILLSGMLLSQLVEEKSNKIIEVIAAAVPIDALFIGKLFAMLAASIIGIVVWVGAGALLIDSLATGGVGSLAQPAVGWPAFLALAVAYFAMNYLLLGAVFLTIGAQAATVREVQTMSMPVTFLQVLIFGIAATSIGSPGSTQAIAAAIFPLSSPMAMLARAAEVQEVWQHAAALLWQILWVALILRLGARLFRRTVLMSGAGRKWWRFGRA